MPIRKANETDASRLADLAAATFPLACPPQAPTADIDAFIAHHLNARRFAEYATDASRTVLLAEDGDQFVGYAMLIFAEPHDPDVSAQLSVRGLAELSKIYVAPERHGAGTARELMAAALHSARDRGASGVWLGTNQENARAQRFYVKSGFARVGTKRFQLGARVEDDYIFEYVFS